MSIFTTEITSDKIPSDNPLHHRLLSAYVFAEDYIKGDVMELGCGEGRGINNILKNSRSYTAVDKIDEAIKILSGKYPKEKFVSTSFPPLDTFKTNSFDCVVSFQVIEHIEDDDLFIGEIYRILRPGGIALLTTPNIKMTLTRNPWHIREYTSEELVALASKYFSKIEIKGVSGNKKVKQYYMGNVKSVQKFKRLDFFNLEKYLPNFLYKIPYEILNRFNRDSLKKSDSGLVSSIVSSDYKLLDDNPDNLDLFLILKK
ncbi:MAG: SAM-dependent methyltransferase [Cytophagia bacterium]|nr:SAM-dependent methyltransferase [Cytophagia bacterium]|tara:strand:- start:580 stop:1353 length:774 start_codon:yes stop_codon:yes gene_type:complete